MSNRQTLPQSITPVNGDVETTIGSPDVTVVGIQGTPFAPDKPQPQQIPVMGSDGQWHPEDPIVSGPDAPGTSPSTNPVQVAGIDDGNLVRELRTDTYGSLRAVNIEERLDKMIFLLEKLVAATISDKFVDDSEYLADNLTDIQ